MIPAKYTTEKRILLKRSFCTEKWIKRPVKNKSFFGYWQTNTLYWSINSHPLKYNLRFKKCKIASYIFQTRHKAKASTFLHFKNGLNAVFNLPNKVQNTIFTFVWSSKHRLKSIFGFVDVVIVNLFFGAAYTLKSGKGVNSISSSVHWNL